MRSYNLMWNKKLEEIILSYAECRKLYIDNEDNIDILLKENISDDDYHLYEYNSKVNFIIKTLKVKDNKIEDMVIYLLSNDLKEIDDLYFRLRDESVYYIKHKTENKERYFFNDNIGIIKNYEKCIDNKNFMISDLHSLNNITKLKIKDKDYYIDVNRYLSEEDYKKHTNEYFDEMERGSYIRRYAVLKHTGKYDTIYETYNKLLKILKDKNIQIDGLPMEQFIIGRWNEEDENKYVTNIMIPIAEKNN